MKSLLFKKIIYPFGHNPRRLRLCSPAKMSTPESAASTVQVESSPSTVPSPTTTATAEPSPTPTQVPLPEVIDNGTI